MSGPVAGGAYCGDEDDPRRREGLGRGGTRTPIKTASSRAGKVAPRRDPFNRMQRRASSSIDRGLKKMALVRILPSPPDITCG